MARQITLLTLFLLSTSLTTAVDFVLNGFDPSDLALYGDAAIEDVGGGRRRHISLTSPTTFSLGRALYKSKVPLNSSALTFSASFLFSIATVEGLLPGHGIAFLFAPSPGTLGASSAQHLGLFNLTTNGDPTNRVLAVEFDLFKNPEFDDIDANHVGVDLHSLTSVASHSAGFYSDSGDFSGVSLNDGTNYQAWIDYRDGKLNVTMSRVSDWMKRPSKPLISIDLDLDGVFNDEMYVGFCAATGRLVQRHRILGWSFSDSNFSLSEGLIKSNLPDFVPKKGRSKGRTIAIAISVAFSAVILTASIIAALLWRRRKAKERKEEREGSVEEWEVEYWPHRIAYKDILAATDGFSASNLIGLGGNGKVYKGALKAGELPVAIKCFAAESGGQSVKEFLSEVSTLGRLRHRNIVSLIGWSKREGGNLILVYEYMENGSLDRRVFDASEPLDWESRVRILKDVAAGVVYLHEGWEQRVVHRDIKASNVMLDRDMIGRLGDFGLARVHSHGRAGATTRVVGTVGYMAPEVVREGRATDKTDVFGFGVLVLEVVCGRRPIGEDGSQPLIEWVLGLMEGGDLVSALDPWIRRTGGYDEDEVTRVMKVGLLCTCNDPMTRPSMRQAARALEGMHEMDGSDGLVEKLQSMRSGWTGSNHGPGRGGAHLTFGELKQSISSSQSGSDFFVEGR
ncbi:L-type lectin-domain containing receptor kinase VII.1 [Acorus gramineus]|uniref:non-specific serine/threonine protein kinase n=1 Tax=Acorus gramineus TaxID=55184 RepID=A0AAV9AV73_ACOGR|nr:L-type lectin-domain containing receptor kinase VII.1 [Acorus gramineus]